MHSYIFQVETINQSVLKRIFFDPPEKSFLTPRRRRSPVDLGDEMMLISLPSFRNLHQSHNVPIPLVVAVHTVQYILYIAVQYGPIHPGIETSIEWSEVSGRTLDLDVVLFSVTSGIPKMIFSPSEKYFFSLSSFWHIFTFDSHWTGRAKAFHRRPHGVADVKEGSRCHNDACPLRQIHRQTQSDGGQDEDDDDRRLRSEDDWMRFPSVHLRPVNNVWWLYASRMHQ